MSFDLPTFCRELNENCEGSNWKPENANLTLITDEAVIDYKVQIFSFIQVNENYGKIYYTRIIKKV